MPDTDLPPQFQALLAILENQPPEVQKAFQFLMAMAMEEAGKFKLLNVSETSGEMHCTFKSTAGEVFSIVKPEMSKELEEKVRKEIRQILREEGLL